jgi:hypothetical protein
MGMGISSRFEMYLPLFYFGHSGWLRVNRLGSLGCIYLLPSLSVSSIDRVDCKPVLHQYSSSCVARFRVTVRLLHCHLELIRTNPLFKTEKGEMIKVKWKRRSQ